MTMDLMSFKILDAVPLVANRWHKITFPDYVRHSVVLQLATLGVFKYSLNAGEHIESKLVQYDAGKSIQDPIVSVDSVEEIEGLFRLTINVLAEPLATITITLADMSTIEDTADSYGRLEVIAGTLQTSDVVSVVAEKNFQVSNSVTDIGLNPSDYFSVYSNLDSTMTVVGNVIADAKVYFKSSSTVADGAGNFSLVTSEETGETPIEIVDDKSIRFLRGLADATMLTGNYSKKSIYIQPQTNDELLIAVQDVGYRRIEL